MKLSPDLTRYFVWFVAGALLEAVDRRQIRRPVFGAVRAAGVACGLIIEKVSPFSFGMGNHYIEGVIVSAGSALALIGYVFTVVWLFVRRSIGRHSPWSLCGVLGRAWHCNKSEAVRPSSCRTWHGYRISPLVTRLRRRAVSSKMRPRLHRANSGPPGIAVGCYSQ
jgi:hypothetical protein